MMNFTDLVNTYDNDTYCSSNEMPSHSVQCQRDAHKPNKLMIDVVTNNVKHLSPYGELISTFKI